MLVIPAINCLDFECVKKRLKQFSQLKSEWLHLDLADGKFARPLTWNNPQELLKFLEFQSPPVRRLKLLIELHLMVEKPIKNIHLWDGLSVKRFIIHLEAIDREELRDILETVPNETEVGLALLPETSLEDLEPFLDEVQFAQFLAVEPGFSGQPFQEEILDKIKRFKKEYPHIKLEVDGGITNTTAKLVRAAGGDIIVSASYIFNSKDPGKAYKKLTNA